MNKSSQNDITAMLQAWSDGDETASDRLMPLVYDELRALARGYLRRERSDHTLQPTALVHEAYLRLVGDSNIRWQSRAHFFGIAANLMRRILVEHARSHNAVKRAGGMMRVSLSEAAVVSEEQDIELLALDDALKELEEVDPRKSRLVELRFFSGLSIEEAAEVLDIAPVTAIRDWRLAKAWLYRRIRKGEK